LEVFIDRDSFVNNSLMTEMAPVNNYFWTGTALCQ